MNNSTIMKVISLTVGVIIIATVLAPTVADAQITAGTPTSYSNDFDLGHEEYYHSVTETTLTSTGTVATIDGHSISYDNQFRVLLAADTFYVICNYGSTTGGHTIIRYIEPTPERVDYSGAVTITCQAGQYVVTSSLGTHTGTYSHIYAACEKSIADTCTVRPTTLSTHYLPADYSLYFMSDVQSTGYMIYNGEANVVSGSGDASYTRGDVVDGTTDIYLGSTMSITYNGASSTTAVVFIPLNAEGHEDSGGLYYLYGAIVVVVLVSLVAFAAFTLRPRD